MRRAAYPNMWMSGGSPGHALIGALIGFGLGAAVGAKGNAGVRATLAIGTVGAGIGSAIGFSIPSFPGRNMYRSGWPDDDEEASHSKRDLSRPDPKKSGSSERDATRRPSTVQPDPRQSVARAQGPRALDVEPP